MSDAARAVVDKCTFANFLKYFGPGMVLYGMLRLSGAGYPFSMGGGSSGVDSAAIVLALIVLGLMLQQLYRAFFFNPLLCGLKDDFMGRKWENRRQRIRRVCDQRKLSSRDAEWIWGQIKNSCAPQGYSATMNTWSSLVGLLYFVGFSMMVSGVTGVVVSLIAWVCRCVSLGTLGESWVLGELFGLAVCIALGLVVFMGGLVSDNEFERWETYRHCPGDEVLKELMKPVIENGAFARPVTVKKES